jgi:sugar phosphate isomerase/epimerase
MGIGICSYSFHRLLAAGKQDIFRFITDCRDLGCTQLDPWNAHLSTLRSGDTVLDAGHNPHRSHQLLSAADEDYVERVRQAAVDAGMPWGTIAVDGAHIYEPTEAARLANRARAYRWIDVAGKLKARQVRIDAGGPEEMPADVFQIIRDGYRDLIDRAGAHGIEVVFENHWGPTVLPDHCLRLLDGIDGLGFLLDTHNWKPGHREEGCRKLAPRATATHVKTFAWDVQGNAVGEDVADPIGHLKAAGYRGPWGIESVPTDGDEYAGARNSVALLRRLV